MLHGVEWLGRQYSALSKGSAANATLVQTITTLSNRLHQSEQADNPHQERRAAILSLKGLAKDHPKEVALHAGKQLLDFLVQRSTINSADKDENNNVDEVLRSLIETLLTLCTPSQDNSQAAKSMIISFGGKRVQQQQQPTVPVALDQFLETPQPLHALLPLLSPLRSFYLRFSALQLLALLLRHRKLAVQSHVLTSPGGCGAILECLATTSPTGHSLGSSAEIIRNEALLLLPHLVDSNADIQKLIAFEGAFEKLLDVVASEGRIEGGVVVQDALEALEALLRYNVSNQNYFRETLSIPMLAPLLFYPPPLPPNAPVHVAAQRQEQLEGFAFQPWEYDASDELEEQEQQQQQQQQQQNQDSQQQQQQQSQQGQSQSSSSGPKFVGDTQKLINARLVIGIAGLLVQGVGEGKRANQNALLSTGFFHALLDLALGSSAPVPLKTQALQVLASLLQHSRNVQDALGEATVTPIEPIKTQMAADIAQAADVPASTDPEKQPRPNASDAPATTASTLGVTSNAPVEYARLPPQAALLILIKAALHGIPTPHRAIDGGFPSITGFRAAAVKALQSILSDNIDARLFVVASMASAEQSDPQDQPGAVLLEALTRLPENGQAEGFDEFRALFAGMILNSAIKASDTVKDLALRLRYSSDGKIKVLPEEDGGDKDSKKSKESSKVKGGDDDDDDDDDASVLSVLVGNITVALRSQAEAVKIERSQSAGSVSKGPTSASWSRIVIAHLTLLALWLHKSPKSVAHVVADSSNVQTIVQLVAEGANGEPLLVGLGTWVLGVLYEWGPAPLPPAPTKEPTGKGKKGGKGNKQSISAVPAAPEDGSMTRKEIHDLTTSRIGLDQFEAKLERLRDDPRLRLVGPDVLDKVGHRPDPVTASTLSHGAGSKDSVSAKALSSAQGTQGEDDASLTDLWFDWTWAEFWRNESVTVANSLLVPPGTTSAEAASAPAELLDAQRQIEQLRDEVKRLQREVEGRERLLTEGAEREKTSSADTDSLRQRLEELSSQLDNAKMDSSREMETTTSQLSASQERVLRIEKSLEEEQSKAREVQEKLNGSEEQVKILKEQLSVASAGSEQAGQSEEVQKQVDELRNHNESLQKELSQLQSQLTEQEAKVTSTESERQRLSQELADAEKKAQQASESKGKDNDDRVAKVQEELEELKKEHADALASLSKKHDEAQESASKKSKDDLSSKDKEHSDALKSLEEKHAKEGGSKSKEIESLKKQISDLQASSKDKKGGDEGSSSSERVSELEQENQDLLVMLDELSTKRKKDKSKLKELGQDVSDDEDDEDDDDDE
ncbi:unnamed protein product [Sympodiomycopsis kandeliae]